MQITTTEIQRMMQDFYRKNLHMPNTLLIPAADAVESFSGLSQVKIESIFYMKVVYAAISEPRVAVL